MQKFTLLHNFNKNFLYIALIITLGCLIYANSLNNEFLWDDELLIQENIYITNFSYAKGYLSGKITMANDHNLIFYRPLQMITYMFNYALAGLDVKIYHLTNILLHILAALAIYWLINCLYSDRLLSFLTAIFFLTHPLHSEAVTYISGRADSLYALSVLLCFTFYLKHLETKKYGFYAATLLSYIAALMSRESALILPLLLLLYHYTFHRRIKYKQFFLILLVTAGYIIFRLAISRKLPIPLAYTAPLYQRLPGTFAAISSYIRLMIFPFHLHMEYGNKLFSFLNPLAISGFLIVSLSAFYAIRKRRTQQLVFFSIFWFFLALLPFSGLYPINAYMAEHWLYLPSIGLFLLMAKFITYLYTRESRRHIAIIAAVGLLSFYSYLTIKQNNYWREPIAFYERTLEYAPNSSRLHNNLGNAYYKRNMIKEAIEAYKKALEIDHLYTNAYNGLANTYNNIGEYKLAIDLCRKVIEIDPNFSMAYNNLGNAYYKRNMIKEAIEAYKKALEIDPNYTKASNNLSIAYQRLSNKKSKN